MKKHKRAKLMISTEMIRLLTRGDRVAVNGGATDGCDPSVGARCNTALFTACLGHPCLTGACNTEVYC